MKEDLRVIESKIGESFTVEIFDRNTLPDNVLLDLAVSYATDFWAGPWKELLIDTRGNQYGTKDVSGVIYPETEALLVCNGVPYNTDTWGRDLWELANQGKIIDGNNQTVLPFWTRDKAQEELEAFLAPFGQGGFNGEIMLLRNSSREIAGFTAYTLTDDPMIAEKRFPGDLQTANGDQATLGNILSERYQTPTRLGVYLDFAVSEKYRMAGLGSKLFDARISRLQELGAEVIVGRTLKTQPAQYAGNYLARGMYPIAVAIDNPDKTILFTEVSELKPRIRRYTT